MSDILQRQPSRAWPQNADGKYHSQHGNGDKRKNAAHPEITKKKSNQETGEDGTEPAPRIDKSDSLRPYPRGKNHCSDCRHAGSNEFLVKLSKGGQFI
jgi:hypothetical protein